MASPYIHQVRGRLRVRSQAVKGDPECVSALESMLQCTPGVTSASVNPVTGSILVRYAEEVVSSAALLDTLHEWGFLPEGLAAPAPVAVQKPLRLTESAARASLGRAVLRTAVERAIEMAVERSVIKLVSVLL